MSNRVCAKDLFRKGDNVRWSRRGLESFASGKASPGGKGKVMGFGHDPMSLRVNKKGQKTTGTYYHGFWELDPDKEKDA